MLLQLSNLSLGPITSNDASEPWGLFFQDNATPQMQGLEKLHNNIMFYLAIILFAVSFSFFQIIISYGWSNWSVFSYLWRRPPMILKLQYPDGYTGRLNQSSMYLNREGTYFGQCPEICEILHSSMPIAIQSVNLGKFLYWLYDQIGS